MLLEVRREPSAQGCTLGSLFVNGEFACFTLEDVIREVPEEAVEKWKVAGETAIPAGIYQVTVSMSTRFGKLLPILLSVPGFEGVRIHSGNVAADTEGCILVGNQRAAAAVLGSRVAFRSLFAKIQAAVARNELVHITISNPPVAQPAGKVSLA